MLDKAKHIQWIEGFNIPSSIGASVSVSHMLYANDTNILWGIQVTVGIPQPNPSDF